MTWARLAAISVVGLCMWACIFAALWPWIRVTSTGDLIGYGCLGICAIGCIILAGVCAAGPVER